MSAVASGELIAAGDTPEAELAYTIRFPDSQVIAEDVSGRSFRVTRIVESLRFLSTGRPVYSVYLAGPRRTKSGGDHASQFSSRFFGDHWAVSALSSIPAPVCDYLHGEDRLRRMEGIS